MFSLLTGIIYACVFLLLVLSWIAGNKASRLLYGGSAERMARKTRKQMVWSAYVALPAVGMIVATLLMAASMSPVFWEDRVLLHFPLAAVPLLGIWLLALPRLMKLWKETRGTTGAPLPASIREQAANPMIIVPFQSSALGAATIFYFLLVTPVPLQLTKAIVPIFFWLAATAALWMVHNRRLRKVSLPEEAVSIQPRRRFLRGLGIFFVVAGIASVGLVVESQNSKLPSELNMAEGPMDFGGGTELAHDARTGLSLAMLTGPRDRTPDRKFTLTAEKKTVTIGSGKTVDAWTYNGQIPA